jgi:hypothetical protein
MLRVYIVSELSFNVNGKEWETLNTKIIEW